MAFTGFSYAIVFDDGTTQMIKPLEPWRYNEILDLNKLYSVQEWLSVIESSRDFLIQHEDINARVHRGSNTGEKVRVYAGGGGLAQSPTERAYSVESPAESTPAPGTKLPANTEK